MQPVKIPIKDFLWGFFSLAISQGLTNLNKKIIMHVCVGLMSMIEYNLIKILT